ncbi:hypothetical protein CsSME_00032931 [Camellia sinensis var. sinensis]
MSHFGRSGPPDIADTYSLLVLNISFRTTADDLFPYFDKYGKVVDIFTPRDRRTGEPHGFAFVRYKYQDDAARGEGTVMFMTETGIIQGVVIAAGVGICMTMTSIMGGREIIVVEAGVAVQVPIMIEAVVGEARTVVMAA